MSIGKIYNLIVLALLGTSGAMSVLLYTTWSHVREKNIEHHENELRLLRRLNKLKADKEYNTEYYNRLIHDENFAEHVIREGLGVVGKDEIVFRFKDSTPLNLESPMTPPSARNADTKSTTQVDAKPQPQKSTQVALPPSEHQQKSLLRKLFSKDENPPKTEKEIIPQIKIDLSEKQKSENINQPKEKILAPSNSNKSFKIENINVGKHTQIQQAPKKKSTKKRGKNSIRFRAN